MHELIDYIPERWRWPLALLALSSPYLTRGYHALVNGGGVRGIFGAIWFGTNQPKKDTDSTN